jgi:hypothetical protein
MNMQQVLAESHNYLLVHEYEQVFVCARSTGERTEAGSHYGDPQCGVIAPDESWFATGGEGIVIFSFNGGLHEYLRRSASTFFVSAMRFEAPNGLRVLIDPWSNEASVWFLAPASGQLTKLRDGPNLRYEPYRENVAY